jgi:hypothetical protein
MITRPGMNDKRGRAPFRQRCRAFDRERSVGHAEPHFCCHGNAGWHRRANGRNDPVQLFRVRQQHRAATVPVDDLGGTTKVQIESMWRQTGRLSRIQRHPFGIAAEQLNHHRRAAGGATSLQDFGRVPLVDTLGKHRARHANKFGHASVESAGTGQHVAQHVVRESFHRGKEQPAHAGTTQRLSLRIIRSAKAEKSGPRNRRHGRGWKRGLRHGWGERIAVVTNKDGAAKLSVARLPAS